MPSRCSSLLLRIGIIKTFKKNTRGEARIIHIGYKLKAIAPARNDNTYLNLKFAGQSGFVISIAKKSGITNTVVILVHTAMVKIAAVRKM